MSWWVSLHCSFVIEAWTEEQAITDTVAGTRRFARRQLGWWRRDPRIHWFDALALPTPAELLAESGAQA